MKENIYEFPNRSIIEEEAGAWLIKLDDEALLSAADRQALREWLKRSPAHCEELNNLAAFWGKMNVLTELAVPLGKHETQAERSTFSIVPLPQFSLNLKCASAAAAVFVLAVTIVFSAWIKPDPLIVSNGLYATAVGQQQTITLADGSVILLNTNSQMDVIYDEHYRDITLLQGEAYFSVAKNHARPFRVYAGIGRIQAVGTAFSVRLKDQDVSITVTEGRVVLTAFNQLKTTALQPGADNKPHVIGDLRDEDHAEKLGILEAGQTATIKRRVTQESIAQTNLEAIETIEQQELARRLSWRKGLLIFTGESLEDVVAEISRYTTVSIEITDPTVRTIKIGGQFRVGETDAMFDVLEENFGLRVTRLSYNHVQLSAAK